ncbi:hypothetical protein C0995_010411 [Termitomyces sp. Mi166|nr:hypothetical protein C0995_010411 [Termitomyces sp. Mi166\
MFKASLFTISLIVALIGSSTIAVPSEAVSPVVKTVHHSLTVRIYHNLQDECRNNLLLVMSSNAPKIGLAVDQSYQVLVEPAVDFVRTRPASSSIVTNV